MAGKQDLTNGFHVTGSLFWKNVPLGFKTQDRQGGKDEGTNGNSKGADKSGSLQTAGIPLFRGGHHNTKGNENRDRSNINQHLHHGQKGTEQKIIGSCHSRETDRKTGYTPDQPAGDGGDPGPGDNEADGNKKDKANKAFS